MADKLGRQALRRFVGLFVMVYALLAPLDLAAQQTNRRENLTARFSGINYTVRPGDVLKVRIWGWPDPASNVEGSFPVERDGAAFLPVIGRVEVGGKSVEEVQEIFRRRFEQEQRNPVVTVSAVFAVGLMGEVAAPGVIDAAPGYTAFDAISMAGGFTEDANRTRIILVRNGKQSEIGGANPADAAAMLAATPLESGDRLVIQRSRTPAVRTWNTVFQALLYAASLVVLITK